MQGKGGRENDNCRKGFMTKRVLNRKPNHITYLRGKTLIQLDGTDRRILGSIKAGKNITAIAREMGIRRYAVQKRLAGIRGQMWPSQRKALEMKMDAARAIATGSRKFSRQKAEKIISFAEDCILRKNITPLEVSDRAIHERLPVQRVKQMEHAKKLLMETDLSLPAIADATGTRIGLVEAVYRQLVQRGKNPALRNVRTEKTIKTDSSKLLDKTIEVKAGKRKSGKQRKKISVVMAKIESEIVKKAGIIYNTYRSLFDRAGILQEEIEDYIRRSLPQKIERISQMKKGFKSNLLTQINWLALDKLREARRKGKTKVQSLPHEIRGMEKRPELSPKQTLKILEKMAEKAKLSIQEKAVVLGLGAELEQKTIAEMSGTTEPNINHIAKSAREKISEAGIDPEEMRLMK
jgi:DNA-directed RNA polymerase specialized sigma24 family protein